MKRRSTLDFEPLVARFVEDVIAALRGATLDDLRDLLADTQPRSVASPRPAPPPPKRRRKPRAPARPPGPTARATRSRSTAMEAPDPPGHAEITDPERLLAGGPAEAAAVGPTPAHDAPVEDPGPCPAEAPPSAPEPALRATVRLREGESLAGHAAGAVVIRRARRGIEPSALM